MQISATSSATNSTASLMKLAPDGDTAAVEARETRAAKRAEQQNGGFPPKAKAAATQSASAATGKGANIDKMA